MTASTLRAALLASLHMDDAAGLDAHSDAAVDLGVALEITGTKLLKLAGGISDRSIRHERIAGYQLAFARQAVQQVAAAIDTYERARATSKPATVS
jgi:hypothetical protein